MIQLTGSFSNGTTNPSPAITLVPPANGTANGIGLIIFSGGAYAVTADHEGGNYADFFSKKGFTCFVTHYRVAPNQHPAMFEDALAAIKTVRKKSEEFDLDKIGVIGSSAGGHLVSLLLTRYPESSGSVSLRPDFGILCYPVISGISHTHDDSFKNLLGDHDSSDLRRTVSTELLVHERTPPCFMWHTQEDALVPFENSLLFASALRKKNIPFELHIYEKGSHGLGLNTPFQWAEECCRWVNELQ
ncbi:alpha/beta hydrolase [Tichowtungia aerotolerans]|uniref:Prolyl oligopeptidase family serine peptidase n=1 Tax=Tichowtungia aerotolerans TaxID=2697043 RepID=A0A6P1M5R8_9BACT|nr:alpha/beta hydrolase [Tichowtungia aerotolerans]QHI69181.1 prolyl oligopeptidase family serine peptidase [Tichowtungia aerotolerans]